MPTIGALWYLNMYLMVDSSMSYTLMSCVVLFVTARRGLGVILTGRSYVCMSLLYTHTAGPGT